MKKVIKKIPGDKWKQNKKKKHTMIQISMGFGKVVLRGKKVYSDTCQPQEMRSQMNNLTLHLKELEKEQAKPKDIEGKKQWKSDKKINKDLQNSRKIDNSKSWFFEKINKIDKLLARLIKKKVERGQTNKN